MIEPMMDYLVNLYDIKKKFKNRAIQTFGPIINSRLKRSSGLIQQNKSRSPMKQLIILDVDIIGKMICKYQYSPQMMDYLLDLYDAQKNFKSQAVQTYGTKFRF
jgi:hypothetical protein